MNAEILSLLFIVSYAGILLFQQVNRSNLLTPPISDFQQCDIQSSFS